MSKNIIIAILVVISLIQTSIIFDYHTDWVESSENLDDVNKQVEELSQELLDLELELLDDWESINEYVQITIPNVDEQHFKHLNYAKAYRQDLYSRRLSVCNEGKASLMQQLTELSELKSYNFPSNKGKASLIRLAVTLKMSYNDLLTGCIGYVELADLDLSSLE
ncbi:hypothetical protein [Shewanella aestuarii]|uniref:Uncharacterized protein n=1 Tax=Shewanella aestuarii TaxID=1028752 RepID=A0A6G9QPR7_9GAMM|nr:hypothetical protein [Shewanella aestuarii]QIR16584.1 hypothetical protein HBH39_19100 [Shewanella aestuarii]